jgi:hypothetical protein
MPIAIHKMVRSKRRSLALQVTEEGLLVVRAPRSLSEREIFRFVEEKSRWVEKKMHQAAAHAGTAIPAPGPAEEKNLKTLARDAFIERSCLYASKMGVQFEKIRLSSAKTRWGSCSLRGSLSFNWKLIQAPVEILDYVVVHELAHLAEHNHSPRFWAKVAEFFPDYKQAKLWLKTNKL